jgi:hypothetical protein
MKMQKTVDLTWNIGSKRAGSKSLEDWRSPQILRTWFLSSIMLCISDSDITRGPFALPLKTRVLIKSGADLYVSEIELRVKASDTRTASLITSARITSPSGLNITFRTGCKASLAVKSLSILPWISKSSSLLHLHWNRSMNVQV